MMNPLQILLKSSAHLGHLKRSSHPKMKPFLYGRRQGRDLIDLRISLYQLKLARKVIEEVYENDGRVLFYVQSPAFFPILESIFPNDPKLLLTHKWLGGTLTNWSQLFQEAVNYFEEKKTFSKNHKELNFKKKFRPFIHLVEQSKEKPENLAEHSPDLLVIFSAKGAETAIKEAATTRIPTIAIVDSDTDPSNITYPIPGNDDHLKALYFYAKFLLSSFDENKNDVLNNNNNALEK